jgi:hypothetical protein
MLRTLLAAVFVVIAAAVPSQGAAILYLDEASYLAAVGATREYIDFAGSPAATVLGSSFSPDVTFGSCTDSSNAGTCGVQVFHNDNAITDLGGSAAANGVASVAWRFNLPDAYAFGFNYVSGGIGTLRLVASDLSLTDIDTSAATGFIGLVSDTPFYGAIAVNAVFAGGAGNDRYFIDDFRINAVPEPASLALVGLAVGAIGVRRARNARHTTK